MILKTAASCVCSSSKQHQKPKQNNTNTIYKKTPESKEFIPQNLVNIVTECLRKRSTRRLNWKEIEDKLDEVAASLDEVVEPEVKPTIFEEGLQWIKSHFL